MTPDSPEEVLDIVDENDNVIGQMTRGEVYAQGLPNFRVVNIFIKNSRGELWIPRRSPNKKLFPLYLDMSAAGHVESGETYDEAAQKETREELNFEFATAGPRVLGKMSPHEHGVSAFNVVYEILQDEVPNFNRDDFIEYFWLTPTALIERIDGGDKAKSDLPKLVRHFYLNSTT